MSRRQERALSLWEEVLAADYEQRNETDNGISYGSIELGMKMISEDRSEWAGIPMPLTGESLVIDPKYPFHAALSGRMMPSGEFSVRACGVDDVVEETTHRNTFWSVRLRSNVSIYSVKGKIEWFVTPGVHHFGHDIQTLGCSDAWTIESELHAMSTLHSLVSHRAFRQYFLTGTFLETSKRSRVTYMFRRLRPTVAIGRDKRGELKILCSMCLHPIAYYSGSWAGAMCPTDDVLAHLMLMRGDEKLFWRRANQHAAHTPEAGL